MTLFRNWFSQALIHFKPQRRRNAVRLIDIAPEWFWAKGQLFSPWKIWSSPESVTRLSWQKLSAMEFPRIIFTSRSRTPPGSGHERRWSELFKARKFAQTKWITSTRTAQRRYSMTQIGRAHV